MITIRRALPVAAAFTFVLASCGGSSDGGADDVETPETAAEETADDTDDFTEVETTDGGVAEEAAPEEEAAPDVEEPAEEPVATEPTDESVEEPEDPNEPVVGEPADAGFDVALSEWAVSAPTEYTAGEITFNASNGGSFPHELVVIEGGGYEQLPLLEGGAVDEDSLPTGALIGRTGRLGGGATEALTVTLAPGSYVLVCNLGGGNNSHAGQGQRLDITVS